MKKIILLIIFGYLLFIFLQFIYAFFTNSVTYLDNKKIYNNKFIFLFKDFNTTINDKNSSVRKIYHSIFDTIKIKIQNYNRLIYIQGGAILKTENDSIDVQNSHVKLHGYMGEWTKNNCYFVDKNLDFVPCKKQENPNQPATIQTLDKPTYE